MWFTSIVCRLTQCSKSSRVRARAKARRRRPPLAVEALEPRMAPAVFSPLASTPDGSAGSLRADVILADANHHNNTIRLQAATYNLTLANTAGQDDSGQLGDLDLTGAGHTITFIGKGPNTVINANELDRVFQVAKGVTAIFSNVTITGGVAQDDGTAGVAPGTTDALGGGILNQGGTVTLQSVVVTGNKALGTAGHNGEGGGIFSVGSLTLRNTVVVDNQAIGGAGLAVTGSPGTNGSVVGVGGAGNGGDALGGAGGVGEGGGIFVGGGQLLLASVSVICGNAANGGNGGDGLGGKGGNGRFGPGNVNGDGGAGGNGANGGLGQGSAGAIGQGGGIFAALGTVVTLTDESIVAANATTGGTGGNGTGGNGGNGGNGGPGGDGFHGGAGGLAGNGGAGTGGDGGIGEDGGVFAAGKLIVKHNAKIVGNVTTNGTAGSGAPGAAGNPGAHG
jgi:hypothetical protein